MIDDRSPHRDRMVETQLAARGIRDDAVLAAMRAVPSEAFIAGELAEFAYKDAPLPIDAGQTISALHRRGQATASARSMRPWLRRTET